MTTVPTSLPRPRSNRFTSSPAKTFAVYEEEEEDEGAGDYGSWHRQEEDADDVISALPEGDRNTINLLDRRARQYSKRAKTNRRIFVCLSSVSLASASAIPVLLAVRAPTWIAATLGGVTTAAQGFNHLLRPGMKASAIHGALVELSVRRDRLRRELRVSTSADEKSALVEAYDEDASNWILDLASEFRAAERHAALVPNDLH